jgi:phosphoribosylformylglycinamidine cyclo-ligase
MGVTQNPWQKKKQPVRYQDAGVSIDEADRAVRRIRGYARATFTPEVLTDIGSFGAGFALTGYRQPVLVSSADGVGTKIKVAIMARRHGTIGEDLVNHCVNDIMVQGAAPLYFLDYFAAGKLDARVTAEVVRGVARGCKANGCALIGGETAEMPGLYDFGDYDLAGFITGVVEKKDLLTGKTIRAGDILLGLPSSGLHTNGYSLARKLLFEVAGYGIDSRIPDLKATAADVLLKVHLSYKKAFDALRAAGLLKGAAHITGGGITDNLPRILPGGLAAEIDTTAWKVPRLFTLLRELGEMPEDDWRRTLNCGIGLICVVAAKDAGTAREALTAAGQKSFVIGRVAATPATPSKGSAKTARVIYR